MKLVFFGYDFSLDIARRLLNDGHHILKIFSFETDNQYAFNNRLQELADINQIPFSTEKVTPQDIKTLISAGCECFFSSGYLYRIPEIDEICAYGINLHPTMLPIGRGPMVMPRLLLEHKDKCGLTIHKLAPEFDTGDILYQEALEMLPDEDIETLSARIAMRAPDLASMILANLDTYWKNATPQDEAESSYWPAHTDEDRTFNWEHSIEKANQIINAFSRYGMLARFDEQLWAVFLAKTWKEKHTHSPGAVVLRLSKEVVIALPDGYIILKEYYPTGKS